MNTTISADVQNYHANISARVSTHDAFEKITEVNNWWASNFKGSARKLNDVFTVTFGETFVNFKITEIVPDKKIVWHVTDCNLHWLKDKKEWNDTKIVFEISQKNDETKIDMTHVGLMPGIECYENCEKGWDFYIKQSLLKLITTGKGLPETPRALR